MKSKNIAVLMGGISSEREVSLLSGQAVAKALKDAGNTVYCLDVRDEALEDLDHMEIDVAFIALHGYFGEDGKVQQVLENKGIPYTGSGVYASRQAMNKLDTKKSLLEAGILTPDFVQINEYKTFEALQQEVNQFGLPAVIKPAKSGSSIGVSILGNEDKLQLWREQTVKCNDVFFLEKYIEGREFTVGMLDEKALPIIEIIPFKEFFDYEAKYKSTKTRYAIVEKRQKMFDAGDSCKNINILPSWLYDKMQDLALKVHRLLRCKGFSRVDMLLDVQEKIYVLEINTIPGFTEKSLLPIAAKAANISFTSLCEKIVDLALQNQFVSVDGTVKN